LVIPSARFQLKERPGILNELFLDISTPRYGWHVPQGR
jgi:hypothetical protein